MKYTIQPGSFKAFCEKIGNYIPGETRDEYGLNDNPTVWKVSLGQRNGKEKHIKKDGVNVKVRFIDLFDAKNSIQKLLPSSEPVAV